MKHCTTCQHLFADPLQVCPTDHVPLRAVRELEPGMIIRGKYIVLEWIGAGGMATVYRARHRLLNELRAVKVVFPKFASDEEFLRRFRQEAAIARRLRHENAVWVEDLDEIEDGRPFIAMEFLQGNDLRKLIQDQGPLSVERSLRLGAQVASALSAAHKLGIIHRDIKPDNIFVTRDPEGAEVAKVLDFGIAKAKEGVLQGGITATKTGVIIGTPEYMSPEQAEGQIGDKLDGRSDVYSLGVVLYEMLTGQLPFKSDTPLGMCLHHLQTIPRPPHELRPDLGIPEAVSAVLMKALEKRRERRFQSADEMLTALRNPPKLVKPAGNGAAALAPTKISGPQAGARSTEEHSTTPRQSEAAAAQRSISRPQLQIDAPQGIRTRSAEPRTPERAQSHDGPLPDHGKRWRILIVTLAVAVCITAGYLLVTAIQRRNAALRMHDSVLRDLVIEKFQSSPVLQGRSKNITVTVSSDAVTLAGNVPLPGDKDTAANLAREVPGVSDVTNNIAIADMPGPALRSPPATVDSSKGPTDDSAQPQVSLPVKHQARPSTPADSANVSKANDLVRLGNAELDQGHYAAAANDFQKAIQLDAKNVAARSGSKRAKDAQKTEQDVLGPKQ